MNPSLVAMVRASYDTLAPKADVLVRHFYDSLFIAHPSLRAMFPPDMTRQRDHLAAALAVLVRNLDSLEALEPSIMALGARHVAFGTMPEHYPPVRDALLASIAYVSGPAWTPRLEEAWRQTINTVCATMLRGAAAAALSIAKEMTPGSAGRAQAAS